MRTPLLFVFSVFLALLCGAANAQDWAKKRLEGSPRHQEWIDLKQGSRTVKCFVVYPERKEKAPVVVMIHEIMGLTDWAMLAADEVAEAGYIAVMPDFLSGMGPKGGRTTEFPDVMAAREAVSALSPDQVTGDLNAAADYAKTIVSANGKITVAGFCWGGGQSFRFATNRKDLSAVFSFYGPGPEDVSKVPCPVYGFYGGNDNRITSMVPTIQSKMTAASKTYEPAIYDGAGHGFMRSGDQPDAEEANKKARAAAFKRMLEILAKL